MKRAITDEQKSVLNIKTNRYKNRFRKRNEGFENYIWRIYEAQRTGLLNLTNQEIGLLVNISEFGDETDKYLDESAYRKQYQAAKRYYDKVFAAMDGDEYIKELRETEFELQKTMVKVRDEKAALRQLIREQARKESYIDLVKETLKNAEPVPSYSNRSLNLKNREDSERNNDLIIHLTDIHAGVFIDNFWNRYDEDVMQSRFATYLEHIGRIIKRHKVQNCYLVIGEIISGLIHDNLRAENNRNVTEQFVMAAQHITSFIHSLNSLCDTGEINVYITPGNHSRVTPNKEKSLKGENFDNLLPYFLEGQFQNTGNVHIFKNSKDEGIAYFKVRGNTVMASHGDKDKKETVVQNLSLLFKEFPDIVLLGHRHTNGMSTVNDIKIVQSGCVSGSDNYAIDRRLHNAPEQMVLVVNDKGLECLYDIQLNEKESEE